MPPKVRALLALGTLTALVAVATLQPLPNVWGQDKETPTRKVEKQAEEKAEEKTEKKSEEPAPVKEAEVKKEGRGEKTEKEPVKEEGAAPRKVEGKTPMKEEGRVPRKTEGKEPMKEEGKTPEGRPVPRKGDPEVSKDPVPARVRPVPGKEMKEPGEGKRPVPGKEAPKGGQLQFNGGISFDAKNSSTCGKGQICYNYALPTMNSPAGMITGTLVITLNIYQNGSTTPLVFTPPTLMQSGVLEKGDHYCFDVNPATFPGIDLTAGSFDFVASAKFSLNGTDTTILVGSVPQGVILMKNNDYRIECETPTGTDGKIVYDGRTSTTCGKGQICFNLKLPTMKDPKGNVITATGQIHLTLYQNGQPILSLPASPVLNDKTGTRYCFPIDPANMKGLNCDLGGFDFVATAMFDFSEASTASSKGICGIAPNGIIEGVNNDYQCECEGGPGGPDPHEEKVSCCLENKENVIYHEDFDHGGEVHSEYQQAVFPQLAPGTYSVLHTETVPQVCKNWVIPAACLRTKDINGFALLVNGLTNQIPSADPTHVIWQHKVELPSIVNVQEAQYRVCFRYLPLPQCCFNIPARPYAVVEGAIGPLVPGSDNDSNTGCGRLYAATFTAVPGSTINLQILLNGNGMGDGNDLAIDNISVAQIVKVPTALMYFALLDGEVTGGTYTATATATANLTHGPYSWDWVLTDGAGTTISTGTSNTTVQAFTGLNPETSYWVKLLVWSDCNELTGRKKPSGDWPATKKKEMEPVEDPNPVRVKNKAAAPAAKKRSE